MPICWCAALHVCTVVCPAALGDADIVFLKNHGVMVVGASAAEAWDDLYYLERAAEAQRLAMATGRALLPVPEAVAQRFRVTQIAPPAPRAPGSWARRLGLS